jgi:excisionase family DNA binding protein
MDANATALTLTLTLTEDDFMKLTDRVRAALASSVRGDNGYLNVDEAAAYLACSRKRIYDLVQTEKITPERDGRRLLFRESVLDSYVGGSAR